IRDFHVTGVQTCAFRSLDPAALATLDQRLGSWLSLARRYRSTPEQLPELHAGWQQELRQINNTLDLDALERQEAAARKAFDSARSEERRVGKEWRSRRG